MYFDHIQLPLLPLTPPRFNPFSPVTTTYTPNLMFSLIHLKKKPYWVQLTADIFWVYSHPPEHCEPTDNHAL